MRYLVPVLFLVPFLLGAEPAILESGPEACTTVPLKTVQLVDAWRGRYKTAAGDVWVYATRSAYFRPGGRALVWKDGPYLADSAQDSRKRVFDVYIRPLGDQNRWGWAFFFLKGTDEKKCQTWILAFLREFDRLENLPTRGQAVAFPSILSENLQ